MRQTQLETGLLELITLLKDLSLHIGENGTEDIHRLCRKVDISLRKGRESFNKEGFLRKAVKESPNSFFDPMGYFISYYILNTHLLDPDTNSKQVIYDGECLEININNYAGEEQLVLGTCAFL